MDSFNSRGDSLEYKLHRIIKKAGVERVSKSACKELATVLEEIGVEIGEEALEFQMYSGRRIVRGKDVKIATKKVLKS